MKKILTLMVALILIHGFMQTEIVEALGTGASTGITMSTQNSAPLIWMCDERVVMDDDLHGGRTTFSNDTMYERIGNYAFEGEQIQGYALVMDKNGIENLGNAYITIGTTQQTGNPIEVSCNMIDISGEGCFGTPVPGTCENYNYTQCMDINGCNLVCDRYVDNVGNCDGNIPCDTTIQAAITAAAADDVICVYDGTYTPFTVNGKNGLTIKAISNPVVKGVQSVTTNYGDRDSVVFVEDSTNIVLEGLDIQGENLGSINQKSYGIIYEESSGEIKDCIVSPNTIGNMYSTGIGIWDNSDVNIDPTLIENFGRIGVFIYNGVAATIEDSTIIGQVYSGELEVCYGIEVEGAYNDATPGTGSQVTIKNNEIYNCDNTFSPSPSWGSGGIYINGWMEYFDEEDSTVIIENNEIHDNYRGIIVIKSSSSYAHNNNIYNNRVYGIESLAAHDSTTAIFDAENNWWDSVNGPTHTSNPGGDGDAVSDNVDYNPFEISQIDIPGYTPQKSPICEGTPTSCEIIPNEYKCDQETDGCSWYTPLMDECNARIGTNPLIEFDSDTMQYYKCLFTVETPASMFGEYWITAEVCDSTECSIFDENEYWFFNPTIALEIVGGINFGTVTPGTVAYSDTILVRNGATSSSQALLDMFISSKDFYESTPSGAMCPTTNRLKLGDNIAEATDAAQANPSDLDDKCDVNEDNDGDGDTGLTADGEDHFCYYATQGTYSSFNDPRADTEGYIPIVYGDSFTKAFYNDAEIIGGTATELISLGGIRYYAGNVIAPGSEIAITFKLGLPEPCNGNFDDGSIYFWAEVI